MSVNEQVYWKSKHPDELWLARQTPPSRDAAAITPLAVGDERKLGSVTLRPDSNAIYVLRPKQDRYVWVRDFAGSSSSAGARLREERGSFGDLYELYWTLGQNSQLPGLWVHPEYEPFLQFSLPRL